jgi:hypothetical protein
MTPKSLAITLSILLAALIFPYGSEAQVSVIGELSQDKDARAGESYTGVIVVRNDTNEPQEAKVYQTDYMFQSNGTNNYAEPGTLPRSNAKWISFSPSYITLPPQATIAVNYTVMVPRLVLDSVPVGTYWSMLMVEGIQKGSAESSLPPKEGKAQMGIMQTIRYGIQIATTIAGTGTKKIQFVETKIVTKEDGKKALQIDIENIGDIGIRPEVYVELFNAQGTSLGKFSGVRYRIYPGTSVRQLIDVNSVPSGTYKAVVVVDAGGEDVFGAQVTLKF